MFARSSSRRTDRTEGVERWTIAKIRLRVGAAPILRGSDRTVVASSLIPNDGGSMSYTIITVTVKAAHFTTDFEKASDELSKLVTDALNHGWTPQGGVAVGL